MCFEKLSAGFEPGSYYDLWVILLTTAPSFADQPRYNCCASLSLSLSATSGNFVATFSFFSSKTAFSVLSLSSPIVDFHVSLLSPSSHCKDDFKLFLFHCLLTIFIVILYSLSLPIGINFTYVPFVAFFYLYSLSRTFFFFH